MFIKRQIPSQYANIKLRVFAEITTSLYKTLAHFKAGVNLKTEKNFEIFFWNYDSLFIGLTVIICSFAVFEVFPC